MPRLFNPLFRLMILLAVAWGVSGCSGWIERQAQTASRAIDCAVVAAAEAPVTVETRHCKHHPAARRDTFEHHG